MWCVLETWKGGDGVARLIGCENRMYEVCCFMHRPLCLIVGCCWMFYDLVCCVRGSSGCSECSAVCCACFSLRTQICEHLGYCVVVENVCMVCVWCVCKLCVSAMCVCVWVVCLCKSVVVVCVWCCEWVSVCMCSCFVWLCGHLFMCSLVLVFMVCVSVCCCCCATTLCCVVALNNRHTHTMNTNATLHMKTPSNPMILVFRMKQTSGGSKVKEHPRFSFAVQLSCGP